MSINNMRFISTSTVLPAVSDHEAQKGKDFGRISRIELTPWDLPLALSIQIQRGLLFHKPITDSDSFSLGVTTTLADHLKSTLSQALKIFYPLAGRLAVIENIEDGGGGGGTSTFFIDCNGAGALFVHAAIDGVTVADILHPVIIPDGIIHSLFPMNGALNVEASVSGSPPLAVQVTELVDGMFVACTMNHCVGDGTSFWHFINVWSEISRGGEVVCGSSCSRPPPVFCRQFLDGLIDVPISIPFSRDTIISKINRTVPPPNLQERMFRFSKEKIAEIKKKANTEMGIITNKSNYTETISSLQALLAHLWISTTRNRRSLDPGEEVCCTVMAGMRPRIQPPLSEGYFGNSILKVTSKCKARELLEKGLGWAAWKINRVIASQTAMEVRKFLKDWVKSPRLPHVAKFPPNTLMAVSSPRFDVYGNDFGWGRPVAVRSCPATKFDGKLIVFPGAEEGSIDFQVCLLAETLDAMACDADFVETLAK